MRNFAEQIFRAGVEQVLPDRLLRSQLRFEQGRLRIGNHTLPPFRKLFVMAAGKAAASMAKEAEEILGDRITAGHVLTKYGHGLPLKRLAVSEAGHPLPDAAGVEATRRLFTIARQAQEGDLLLCLLSGGASALMTDLPEGCSLDELILANDLLVKSGADIAAINTLRKHVSEIKGGQLAAAAAPAN
ncbi:MAG: glycerate-2-kinase family protein, partial [Bacteroidales bacterium]|nr:glycerate-2-kinase family protein [Bacteroidales bacterium]